MEPEPAPTSRSVSELRVAALDLGERGQEVGGAVVRGARLEHAEHVLRERAPVRLASFEWGRLDALGRVQLVGLGGDCKLGLNEMLAKCTSG